MRAFLLGCAVLLSGCMTQEFVVRTPKKTYSEILAIQIDNEGVMFVRPPTQDEARDGIKFVRVWLHGEYTVECYWR